MCFGKDIYIYIYIDIFLYSLLLEGNAANHILVRSSQRDPWSVSSITVVFSNGGYWSLKKQSELQAQQNEKSNIFKPVPVF